MTSPIRPYPWLEYLKRVLALDRRRRLEVGRELACAGKRAAIDKLAGVVAIANEASAVREKLRDRRARDARVKLTDELPDRVVELELALLA